MKIQEIYPGTVKPWKPALDLVPHLTIETNMTCNLHCKICYNLNTTYVKDLQDVYHEIDVGISKRKVDTMTIMGGEPTLYPDLSKVINYISSKKIFCQLLTNGYLIYTEGGEEFLDNLVKAGLNRIIFHVDFGQDIYQDPFEVLHNLFTKTSKHHLLTSISWTIYSDSQGILPQLITKFMKYAHFDGILALLERPVDLAISPGFSKARYPNMLEEHKALDNTLNVKPSLYLPSSIDDSEVSWLVYLYFINTNSGKTFCLSPLLTRFSQKLSLKVFKREMFGKPLTRSAFGISLVLTGLLELLVKPGRTRDFFRMLIRSVGTKHLRFHYIAIQDAPSYDQEAQKVSICYGCPDATIRNGKLTPVCLADRINPLPGARENDVDEELAGLVFSHLGEN
jgi:hypothetical protein